MQVAGICQSTFRDLVSSDDTGWSLKAFAREAKALGVNADYLLEMEEPKIQKTGRRAVPSGLTELEAEILNSVRVPRLERRQILASIASDIAEEDAKSRRHMALLRKVEALDKAGLLGENRE